MAHTDKTDPFWIRIRTGYYDSYPWHQCFHLGHDCDLPPLSEHTGKSSCTWEFRYDGRNVCACKLCSGMVDWYSGPNSPHWLRRKSRSDAARWAAEYNGYGSIDEW